MNNFEIIKNVLNKKFLRREQVPFEMQEDKALKGKPVHKITIDSKPSAKKDKNILDMALYRFDAEKDGNFLPFFENDDNAPEGLSIFPDYILLVKFDYSEKEKFNIFMFELKRTASQKQHATKQLQAGEIFLDYVFNTIERIKTDNDGFSDFDSKNIKIHKFVLMAVNSENKNKSKNKTNYQKNQPIFLETSFVDTFSPIPYCS